MGLPFGSRTLIAAAIALILLLGALAAMQWRWSLRVAAADEQREREHLDSSASLFADEFNKIVEQAGAFLQNDAADAVRSGKALTDVPKLIDELFYIDASKRATARRLTKDGRFVPAAPPNWMGNADCATAILQQPLVLIAPVRHAAMQEIDRGSETRFLRTFRPSPEGCFVARIDETYLSSTVFPQLIRTSFGISATSEYNFAVVWRNQGHKALYGAPTRSDMTKSFFSIAPTPLPRLNPPSAEGSASRGQVVFFQRFAAILSKNEVQLADLFGPGIWQLQVAHKDAPLPVIFQRQRWRDLLLSLGVEFLLIAAVLFLAVAARQMQRLANRKMQFVAGVSHELRTPVSAITMLSRNQADGLITGPDRVKQYGELMHQQARRLNEMVEQALQYAGIHSGLRRPANQVIDLRQLIRQTVDTRHEELERGGFVIEVAVDPNLPQVRGDAQLLKIALENLLDNAQRHARSGCWIRVAATCSVQDKEVRVSVEDRGEGIESSDRKEIFEPFYRGRAAIQDQVPGSGLGLSLVRDAALAHRGSVTLVSEPGHGSTFTLHLPL